MNTARRDLSTYVGMLAVAVAAAVLSFSTLSGLAELAGVSGEVLGFKLAWLLPIAIDAYAVTATRVWLRNTATGHVRQYARSNAVGAIGLSVTGNGAYHFFASAGVTSLTSVSSGWLVVVTVSAVPPVILGLVPVQRDESKGAAEKKMRDHWAAEGAQGRTPSGAKLDRVAGTRDYGRKVRRTLLAEEAAALDDSQQDIK
ncbi:DUF2637 domain-containing protein [Frankia sp. Cj3]|uniref:DUF2637 domain-containing protein n=1 Tax=Frankia sp. Cj3 TaxID=2880976 RepID=UPI001EF6A1B0|nr:DUF2637 domain-containing protein [Frankia sp. Cj3]